MKLKEAMAALEAAGSEQTRKTYRRHGVQGDMFGVSYAVLEKLRKTIKVDHELAEGLWKTGNHDARVLATMIADPNQTSAGVLTAWANDSQNHVLAGAVSTLARKTRSAESCFREWSVSPTEAVSAAGWHLLAELATHEESLPDPFFEEQLKRIEEHIHSSMNRARYSMNGALIAIGCRNPRLEKQALQAAKRIGKVEVDHGDTSCQTPDAAAYIKKCAARKKK
jgi:3-methyladenine DNA glycosylase AlkD